jgi:excisionase family DNA binding protein
VDEIKSELLRVARELPPEHLPRFFADLEEIRRTAEMQLHVTIMLMTVTEASKRLRVSKDTLYRNEFPFTRHIGRHRLFSRNGIDRAIMQSDLTPERTDVNLTHPKRRRRLN